MAKQLLQGNNGLAVARISHWHTVPNDQCFALAPGGRPEVFFADLAAGLTAGAAPFTRGRRRPSMLARMSLQSGGMEVTPLRSKNSAKVWPEKAIRRARFVPNRLATESMRGSHSAGILTGIGFVAITPYNTAVKKCKLFFIVRIRKVALRRVDHYFFASCFSMAGFGIRFPQWRTRFMI